MIIKPPNTTSSAPLHTGNHLRTPEPIETPNSTTRTASLSFPSHLSSRAQPPRTPLASFTRATVGPPEFRCSNPTSPFSRRLIHRHTPSHRNTKLPQISSLPLLRLLCRFPCLLSFLLICFSV